MQVIIYVVKKKPPPERGLCCEAGILIRSEWICSETAQNFFDPKWQR